MKIKDYALQDDCVAGSGELVIPAQIDSFGWLRHYARGVPEKWPVDFGWMNAYPVEGYDIEKPRGFTMTISKNAE